MLIIPWAMLKVSRYLDMCTRYSRVSMTWEVRRDDSSLELRREVFVVRFPFPLLRG